jgi:hypothetical protein
MTDGSLHPSRQYFPDFNYRIFAISTIIWLLVGLSLYELLKQNWVDIKYIIDT